MKYLFHTVTLGQTGGVRVILNLSKILVDRGHDVTIIIDRNKVDYKIPEGVNVKFLSVLGLSSVRGRNSNDDATSQYVVALNDLEKVLKPKIKALSLAVKWLKYFLKLIFVYPMKFFWVRNFLKQNAPDLIASHNMYQEFEHFWFYRGFNFFLVLHNSPREVYEERSLFSLLPVREYLSGIKTIAVSEDASLELESLFGAVIGERHTIYNPFDFELIRSKAGEQLSKQMPEIYFLVVAALAPRKRVDRLIKAIQKVDSSIELVILGEGGEEASLKSLANSLGVANRVHFEGFCENPYAFISGARGLLLSSNSEGLPTVLIESLICGTPVVSTDCPTGPREILQGHLSHFLIELGSEEDIANDFAVRIGELSSGVVEISSGDVSKYHKDVVASQWEQLAGVVT